MIVNGRFMWAHDGGFRSYAAEISSRLADGCVVSPPRWASSGVAGRAWEQTALLARARNEVLWSPANSGPLGHPNHIVTIHDLAPIVAPDLVSARFAAAYRRSMPRLVQSAARIVVHSTAISDVITTELGADPDTVTVVPPGVDDRFRTVRAVDRHDARARLGLPGDCDGPMVGTFVSSIPRKRSARTVGLLGDLARNGSVGAAVAAGWNGPRRVFGSEARPGDADVADLGPLDDDRFALFMRALDAFVWLPVHEGFGLPLVEAVAAGTPVVCTPMPSALDHLTDVAEIVVPGDVNADRLARVVARATERTAEPSEDVTAHLTWERAASTIDDLAATISSTPERVEHEDQSS